MIKSLTYKNDLINLQKLYTLPALATGKFQAKVKQLADKYGIDNQIVLKDAGINRNYKI